MSDDSRPLTNFFSILICIFFALVTVAGFAILLYAIDVMRLDSEKFSLGVIFVILSLSLSAVGIRGIFYARSSEGGMREDRDLQRISKLAQRDPLSVMLGGFVVIALAVVAPSVAGAPGEFALKCGVEGGAVGLLMVLAGATQLSRRKAAQKAAMKENQSGEPFSDGYR